MTKRNRLKKLRQHLASKQAFLLSNPRDIVYFAHFFSLVPAERETFLIVTPEQAWLLHNSFSPYQAPAGLTAKPGCSIQQLETACQKLKDQTQLEEIFIDQDNLVVNEYQALKKLGLTLRPLDRELVWSLRTIKDQQEIASLKQAGQVTQKVMTRVWTKLEAGQTEKAVRNLIEAELKKAGSSRPAFPTIVAFGAHTALPHHQPTETQLENKMAVLIDFGATIDGYCGDMTRSGWFGSKIPDQYQELEKIVKTAYQASLTRLSAHQSSAWPQARELDQSARQVIKKAGYGPQYIHTTGHGLGLDIHESLSLHQGNHQLIKPGMVLTLEPGIYLPGHFGYRHENMVLVTADGAEELTA